MDPEVPSVCGQQRDITRLAASGNELHQQHLADGSYQPRKLQDEDIKLTSSHDAMQSTRDVETQGQPLHQLPSMFTDCQSHLLMN